MPFLVTPLPVPDFDNSELFQDVLIDFRYLFPGYFSRAEVLKFYSVLTSDRAKVLEVHLAAKVRDLFDEVFRDGDGDDSPLS